MGVNNIESLRMQVGEENGALQGNGKPNGAIEPKPLVPDTELITPPSEVMLAVVSGGMPPVEIGNPYTERERHARLWRNGRTRLKPYLAGERMDIYGNVYQYEAGTIQEVFYNNEWQQVMADEERPYSEALAARMFFKWREDRERSRRPYSPPRVLEGGYGKGFSFRSITGFMRSTWGGEYYIVELNKPTAQRARREISEQLNNIKRAFPGLRIDVVLIEDDFYHAIDVFADAIQQEKSVIPDEAFQTKLTQGEQVVHRFSTRFRPPERRDQPITAGELPILAKQFDLAYLDLYPLEKEDAEGVDSLRKLGPTRICLSDDGYGGYFPHHKGSRGGVYGKQRDLLNTYGFAYETGPDVELKPSKEYKFLEDENGYPVTSINTVLFWKKLLGPSGAFFVNK